MPTYEYTCRGRDGRLRKGAVRAESRAAAVRGLRASGTSPVSVAEAREAAGGRVRGLLPWAALVLGVVVTVCVSLLFFRPRGQAAGARDDNRDTVRHVPAVRRAVAPHAEAVGVSDAEEVVISAPYAVDAAGAAPPAVGAAPPAGGIGAPAAIEEAGAAPAAEPSGFRTATDQLLALAASVELGVAMPPLPVMPGVDADFAGAAGTDIIVYDGDDDRTVEHKASVARIKAEMARLVAGGESAGGLIRRIEAAHNEVARVRDGAQAHVDALCAGGQPGEAAQFAEEVNREFLEAGVRPVRLPRQMRRAE